MTMSFPIISKQLCYSSSFLASVEGTSGTNPTQEQSASVLQEQRPARGEGLIVFCVTEERDDLAFCGFISGSFIIIMLITASLLRLEDNSRLGLSAGPYASEVSSSTLVCAHW